MVPLMIAATGATARWSSDRAGCCGALHVHAGLEDQARRLAERVMADMPGTAPVLALFRRLPFDEDAAG